MQVLRILTLGDPASRGGFSPSGINGRINTSAGYSDAANALNGWPGNKVTVVSLGAAGRSGLLNTNRVFPSPAPQSTQYEASGREYPRPAAAAPVPAPTSAPLSPSPSFACCFHEPQRCRPSTEQLASPLLALHLLELAGPLHALHLQPRTWCCCFPCTGSYLERLPWAHGHSSRHRQCK
jgi:hypothetical protein